MQNLKLKCVQLDLARQIESVEYIKNFIDMVSACGFNSVLLYLEDRVRTASYPYPAEGQAYSPDEIRDLVAYAEEKKIELIPCVATLGHAERFLEHKELSHLSEVQGDSSKNRFGSICTLKDVFCMNHEEFYPFIETYIAEVAELFPSQYFHAGLDEFFDFNLCPACRAKMTTLQLEEDAFLSHIIRINAHLNKLGKRMMMWSDMFEIYTTVMARIPQNIIMVDWQYQEDVRFYMGHLLNMTREPRQKINDQLGLTAVAASWDRVISNVTSTIKYAVRNHMWGYLLTTWEKMDIYLYRAYPLICYVGYLLSGQDEKTAWEKAINLLFGSNDTTLSKAVRLFCSTSSIRHFAEISDPNIFARPYVGIFRDGADQRATIQSLLEQCRDQVKTEIGKRVWKDMWNAMEEMIVASELKEAAWDLVDYGNADEEDFARLARTEKRYQAFFESKQNDWKTFRAGVEDTVFTPVKEKIFGRLHNALEKLKRPYDLMIRYCMPDQYGVNSVQVDVFCNGQWIEAVPMGGYKYSNTLVSMYEWMFPLDLPGVPEKVRISHKGMGGRGICYVHIRNRVNGANYIPEAITECAGIVEHPDHLLADDCRFAYFNHQSTRYGYVNPGLAEGINTVTLSLTEE